MLWTLALITACALRQARALSGKASTTRYYDGTRGACGCGTESPDALYPWQKGITGGATTVYTAAGSQSLFQGTGSNPTWCGTGCGTCYTLTSEGAAPEGQGTGGTAGDKITVMITNLCPAAGNEKWCPSTGANQFGYDYHFDIMAEQPVFGDNAVVTFESVACPGAATTDFAQCACTAGAGAANANTTTTPSVAPPEGMDNLPNDTTGPQQTDTNVIPKVPVVAAVSSGASSSNGMGSLSGFTTMTTPAASRNTAGPGQNGTYVPSVAIKEKVGSGPMNATNNAGLMQEGKPKGKDCKKEA